MAIGTISKRDGLQVHPASWRGAWLPGARTRLPVSPLCTFPLPSFAAAAHLQAVTALAARLDPSTSPGHRPLSLALLQLCQCTLHRRRPPIPDHRLLPSPSRTVPFSGRHSFAPHQPLPARALKPPRPAIRPCIARASPSPDGHGPLTHSSRLQCQLICGLTRSTILS